MPDQYYYRNTSGQESGPYDAEECRRMVSVGLLEMNGMIREANSETWQSAGAVFPAGAARPAPPPLQPPEPSPLSAPAGGVQIVQARCTRTTYILVALLPGILAGIFGIHNLIAGYSGRGIVQLALSACFWLTFWWTCLTFLIYPALLVWVVVECIQVKVDANKVPMTP